MNIFFTSIYSMIKKILENSKKHKPVKFALNPVLPVLRFVFNLIAIVLFRE